MNKYIPADELLAEIDRRILQEQGFEDGDAEGGYKCALKDIKRFITSLQHEQPTSGYDEAYLNECIAKARKTWKGVDVDKYMDEIRGREQEQPDNEDIDKVAQELYEHLYELKRRNNVPTNLYDKQEIIDLWKAGVEYGRNHSKQEQPKFKVGDTIHEIGENTVFPMTIERISDGDYVCVTGHTQSFINIEFQDDYELVEQEQPDVDLEKEIELEWGHREKQEVDLIECAEMEKDVFARFARHFYELGRSRKEE